MKLTLNWLQKYVDLSDVSPDKLAEHLTMLGLEVDAVTPLYDELSSLLTGHVLSAEKHPNADKLSLCQVQVGEETHQIVCGAPNVRQGLSVVVALPGTVLPGNFKIKKSKIRGIESFGMICSERELGLSNEHDGIMELPDTIEHGISFIQAMELEDTFVEVDLTPNRPDCASVIGIAREVAGFVKKPLQLPAPKHVSLTTSTEFSVEVESSSLCPRYAGILIKGVTVGPSPWWLKRHLLSIGLRPINNIVDITNFVMMEYGQPLHAFDFDNLSENKIVVRVPRNNEKTFTTLDGIERILEPETLMICDGKNPIAIAGVMGGLDSEVTADTKNILLESACFNPVSIRKTARRLKLATDASYRFERGIDPDGTLISLKRAADLICELAGGHSSEEGIDCYDGQKDIEQIQLRVSKTNGLLGINLSAQQIIDLLESIELQCAIVDENTLMITPPSFRVDLEREADLIEEVARLFGYDNIPISLPKVNLSYPEQDENRIRRLDLAKSLTSIGFTEAINYSFIAEAHTAMLGISAEDERHNVVPLLNPLSEDQAVLRPMILPGLLENVKRNINFQKSAIKLFEIGKIFIPNGENKQPLEKTRLTGVLSGNRYGESSPLHFKHEPVDIYDAKGCVEFVIREMGLGVNNSKSALVFSQPQKDSLEPYGEDAYALEVTVGTTKVGSLGKIKNDVLKKFSIKNDVYYLDLDYDGICELQVSLKAFSSLPVFPSVKRDIALVVPETVSAGDILNGVRSSSDKLIESSEIFDVFQGEKIEAGYKSIALTITYRSQTKTLTEKNVEKSHSKIVRLLTDQFGGSFRNE